MDLDTVVALLIIFQLKHFLADYPLQGRYMLQKFHASASVWVPALSAHAVVHAVITFGISFGFSGSMDLALLLAALDFGVHFAVDRLKASPNLGGRWSVNQPYFWWALGADQMAHHLTHYLIIFILVTR